jgi:hypothetical protein
MRYGASSTDWDEPSTDALKRLFPNGGTIDTVYIKVSAVIPQVRKKILENENLLIQSIDYSSREVYRLLYSKKFPYQKIYIDFPVKYALIKFGFSDVF